MAEFPVLSPFAFACMVAYALVFVVPWSPLQKWRHTVALVVIGAAGALGAIFAVESWVEQLAIGLGGSAAAINFIRASGASEKLRRAATRAPLIALVLSLAALPACGQKATAAAAIQAAQPFLGRVVPFAHASAAIDARPSFEHIYADAAAGGRVGIYVAGIGDAFAVCIAGPGIECADGDLTTAPGEWAYDVVFTGDENQPFVQLVPVTGARVSAIRAKLGLPPRVSVLASGSVSPPASRKIAVPTSQEPR